LAVIGRKPTRRGGRGGASSGTGARRAGGPRARGRLAVLARRLAGLALAAAVLALLWVARAPILRASARLLTVQDALAPADAILVLGGDPDSRPDEAARLFRRGFAPRVLLVRARPEPSVLLGVRPNDTDLNIAVLRRLGVPAAAIHEIEFPGGASSTYDEARAFREWAYGASPRSVIIATSAFHTRRARWLFRRQLDGLRVKVLMAPAREPDFDESNWWRTERGLILYLEEYIKFFHEWTRD
jgi:uncharacterized SAM-binding protein YcdF (DUF218 family)